MHLFLSPHLDDAALSCGGRLFQLANNNEKVTIINIMAGDPPTPLPNTPIVNDLHQRWQIGENPVAIRRQEDEKAVKILGVSVEHRKHPDCVYRTHNNQALYPDEDALFGAIHPDDHVPKQLLIEAAMLNFVYVNIESIYVPLGVGHHVDHQIVRNWGIALAKRLPDVEIIFYEEYPYTRDFDAIQVALDNLPTELNLEAQLIQFDKAEITAKIQAIDCYRSQLSTFWNNRKAMIQDVKQAFYVGDGMFGERYWYLKTGRNT